MNKLRHCHYLKTNEKSESLQHCIFVDTETDLYAVDEKHKGHRLRFGWAAATHRTGKGVWGKPNWKRFTAISDFWLWAMHHTKAGGKTWMWCHNSSFDYPVLDAFRHLPDIGWKLEGAIIDAPPTVVTYRSGKKTLVLCDTLNIWRMSLKELGERIGLEKLTMPEEWKGTEDDDTYCRRDVEIILRSIIEWSDFLRANDLGGFCPTIAAQAMRSFRHRWLSDRILIDNNNLALDLARKCYHGGRCEAGYIGHRNGPIYYLDVNSMYPFVMSYAEMPCRLKGISRMVQPGQLRRLLNQYCVCAHVRLNTDVPFAAKVINGKLCFPTGTFDAYLTTPEIEYALDRGAVTEVHLCASYEREIPFRKFALDLYEYKENSVRTGKVGESRHWKLILNSFYGKWGQHGHHWNVIGNARPDIFLKWRDINAQTLKQSTLRIFGGRVFERSEEGESRESHPAIAAHITGHARMVLWTLIEKIPPSEYLYCDTDGILVTAAGRDALAERFDDYKLGYLKQVAVYDHVLINGCKDYVLDGQETLKGIKAKAVRLDEKTYIQEKWSSLRGLLAANSINVPLTSMVTKSLSRTYDKGIVGADGFVSPLHLEDTECV